MAHEQMGTVLQFIRRAVGAGDASSDADLVGRFAAQREEAAFTALLQRHGPMVLGVCRRVLDNAADADDALQATFLVLVRRAGSIRKSASVASWLHGVALRVALEARTRAARRRAHEQRAEVVVQADAPGAEATRELRAILDEELEHLPAKYRSPLVLHYFEGKTKDETARQLGWSEGTVSGRLARARDLLRHRLGRRGLMLSSGMLAAALTQEEAALAMSAVLTESTLKTATLFAAGEVAVGASAARIAALTERVVHTMFLTKLKIATAVLLVAAVVGLGAGGLFYQAQADPPADKPPPESPTANAAGALQDQPAQPKKAGVTVGVTFSETHDVALTADGKTLARAGYGRLDLWDVASGKKLHRLGGNTATLLRVKFSPDGKTLASITGGWGPDNVPGEVKLWDVATGKERVALKGHPDRGIALAFSPDGKTLASSTAGPVKLWDVDTGKEKLELKFGKDGCAWSLAFSPDGKTLATGMGGGLMDVTPSSVIFWDVTTGKERARTLPAHANSITCVRFASDGKTLASVSGTVSEVKPGALKLWEVATAKERATIPIRITLPVQFIDLAFTADGKTLTSAMWSFDEKKNEAGLAVDQWELATGKARATFWAPPNAGGGNNAGMYFAALSADGKTVAWGDQEKAHVWDVESLPTSPPKLPKEPEKNAGAEQAGKKPAQDNLDGEQLRLTGHTGHVWTVCVSADGKRLLTSSDDKTLRLWDADTGKQLRVFEGHTERIVGAALSPDGKRVLSGGGDRTVRLWDATTGKQLQKMTGHAAEVWSVAFGPEGQAISGGVDGPMHLWDLNTGKNTRVFTGHTSSVHTVAYSDKARLAATSSLDQSIRLWDLETGKEVRKLTGHSGNSDIRVCFSSDGKRLVSGSSGDNSVRIWDVETGKELKRIDAPNACCAAFSPDGKRIVSGGYLDHIVRVWDAESGKELRKHEGHTSAVVGVAFFPDGKRIVSASYDCTARIWRAPNLSEGRTIKRLAWFLIDAKTKGVSEQTETKGTGIKQIEISEGIVAKEVLLEAKDTNGDQISEYLGYLGREWVVKSVKLTLADDTVVEAQILLAKETGKATLQNVKKAGPRVVSDKGTRTWNAFYAENQVATDSSKEDIAQAEKDMEALQGTWRESKMTTVVVKGDRLSQINFSAGPRDVITGLITIDAKTKAIDWPMETGLGLGVTCRGIYELKGDNLRILFGGGKIVGGRPVSVRPKTFDEDGWPLVLKREKPTSPPKLPKEPEKPAEDKKPRMITASVMVLISAKTDGISEGAKIKQIDTARESTGKRDITNAKIKGGSPRLNGSWLVKTCTIVLADGKSLEKREVLFGVDFGQQEFKNVRYVETCQAKSDQGIGTWYVYTAECQTPAPPDEAEDKVVKAWQKAGAEVGWHGQHEAGHWEFSAAKPNDPVALPAFRWYSFEPGVIVKLPVPSARFALDLSDSGMTDAGLKELAGLQSLQTLNLSGTEVTDAGLKELAGLKSLRDLNFAATNVTDAGLKALAGLKNLQHLYVGHTTVTDAGLKELAGLKNLHTLVLTSTRVTHVGLKELAGLKNLQHLYLDATRVTDAGLKELAGLKSLQTLNLKNWGLFGPRVSAVTDAGLKELAGLTSLQKLDLTGTQVTDAGLKALAGLKSLQKLDLTNTKVTGAGLKELAGLQSLQTLGLSGTQVTDAGLKELAGLKSLQNLNLTNTKVTGAGLRELAGLQTLQTLGLSGTQVKDAGLKELAGLKRLQTLGLGDTQVTDEGLKELAGLKSLQSLGLSGTYVTGTGLKKLAGLKSLQSLFLSGKHVTDTGLKDLAGLKSLQNLSLVDTQVTETGLKQLPGIQSLQNLNLYLTKVTDAGLKGLAGLKSLQSLDLKVTQVTDAGLKELSGLNSLQTLDLGNTKMTDAGLKELTGLRSLQNLNLNGTDVTDAGVAELGKALPKVRVKR